MFCDKLRFLREHQEITQGEAAKQLGLTHATYCRYEKGVHQPDYETLKRIANFFDVSIDYLLENDNVIADREDVVDFNKFILNGRYTINSKFLSDRERKRLNNIVIAIYDDKEKEKIRWHFSPTDIFIDTNC